jgi:glycosyltransferase involved in cell wall biosynthesis
MKIAVDLRSLSSGSISGVENYCLNLLECLLALDKQNQYILFYNSFAGKKNLPDFHYVNSSTKFARIPNKILNLGFKFNFVKLESLIGNFDCLFMPNLNQFAISPKTKLAITVHDLSPVITPGFYDLKRKLWHKFLNYKKAFQRADVLFAVSQYTKNDLMKIFKITSEKIKVIYPGVDRKTFTPGISLEEQRLTRNIYGLPGSYILFLNTVEPRKNLANLIKAFESLSEPISLVIAGRLGWKYSRDFKLIQRSKKSAKIKYIGYVEEKHKPALIKMAKVLAYPSFYEGFGFQALEAMAVGTPVLVSQLTALPEVTGDSALLINPYDHSGISGGLQNIISNLNLRRVLIGKGFEQAKKFDWENTATQILSNLNALKS